jgi:hypothetical protein
VSPKPTWDENALIRLHEKIADSRVFLGLLNEEYKRDPTALVQLCFAMMLEKPIYFLVPKGCTVPRGLRRLADGIEEFDESRESLERAAERVRARWEEHGA